MLFYSLPQRNADRLKPPAGCRRAPSCLTRSTFFARESRKRRPAPRRAALPPELTFRRARLPRRRALRRDARGKREGGFLRGCRFAPSDLVHLTKPPDGN